MKESPLLIGLTLKLEEDASLNANLVPEYSESKIYYSKGLSLALKIKLPGISLIGTTFFTSFFIKDSFSINNFLSLKIRLPTILFSTITYKNSSDYEWVGEHYPNEDGRHGRSPFFFSIQMSQKT